MRNRVTECFQFLIGVFQLNRAVFQFFVQAGDLVFHPFALGDVANRAGDNQSFSGGQRLCAHLDGKFSAVLVQAAEFHSRFRNATAVLGEVRRVILPLGFSKPFRDQQGDAFPLQLPLAITK